MTPEWKIKDFTKQAVCRSPLVNCVNRGKEYHWTIPLAILLQRHSRNTSKKSPDPVGVTAVVEIDEDLYSTKKGQAPKHRNDQREASADANKAKEQEGGDDVIPYVPVSVSLDKYTY